MAQTCFDKSGRRGRQFSSLHAIATTLILGLSSVVGEPLWAQTPETDRDPSDKRTITPDQEETEIQGVITESISGNDPLERVIRNMRQAEERIASRDPGKQTQELQRQIVSDLDDLIELAKQQSQQPNPSSEQQQPKDGAGAPSPSKRETSQQQASPGRAMTRQENEQAAQSSDRSDKAEQIAVDVQRRNQLMAEFWGHLPPTIRQQLLNIREEKYLPKYADLVQQYFEALAEQGSHQEDR